MTVSDITHVVGIDPSLRSTGFAIIDLMNIKNIDYCTFGIPKKEVASIKNYAFLCRSIVANVPEHSMVLMEDYAFSANTNCLTQLAEFGGILKLALLSKTKESVFIVATGTMRKFLSDNGHLPKDEFKTWIMKKFNIDLCGKTNDEAVAICLAKFGVALLGKLDLTKAEKKVISKYIKDRKIDPRIEQFEHV